MDLHLQKLSDIVHCMLGLIECRLHWFMGQPCRTIVHKASCTMARRGCPGFASRHIVWLQCLSLRTPDFPVGIPTTCSHLFSVVGWSARLPTTTKRMAHERMRACVRAGPGISLSSGIMSG